MEKKEPASSVAAVTAPATASMTTIRDEVAGCRLGMLSHTLIPDNPSATESCVVMTLAVSVDVSNTIRHQRTVNTNAGW